MTLRREVVYDNRGRLVRVVNHDSRRAAPAAIPTPRRNEMPDEKRRLEAVEKGIRELERDGRRRLVEPIVQEAIDEGRIAAEEASRWFEYGDTFGVDTVRDLLLERRPDRSLAAANTSERITPAQDRALEQVFPGYKARS